MKKYVSSSKYYELSIPNDWSYSQEDNLVSFYNEDSGVGALQISSYLISNDDIDIVAELSEIISDKKGIVQHEVASQIILSEDLGYYAITKDSRYWEYYMLFRKGKLLLITYNCDEEDKLIEKNIIQKIINSIFIN